MEAYDQNSDYLEGDLFLATKTSEEIQEGHFLKIENIARDVFNPHQMTYSVVVLKLVDPNSMKDFKTVGISARVSIGLLEEILDNMGALLVSV